MSFEKGGQVSSAILLARKGMKKNVWNKFEKIFASIKKAQSCLHKEKKILAWEGHGLPFVYDKRMKSFLVWDMVHSKFIRGSNDAAGQRSFGTNSHKNCSSQTTIVVKLQNLSFNFLTIGLFDKCSAMRQHFYRAPLDGLKY